MSEIITQMQNRNITNQFPYSTIIRLRKIINNPLPQLLFRNLKYVCCPILIEHCFLTIEIDSKTMKIRLYKVNKKNMILNSFWNECKNLITDPIIRNPIAHIFAPRSILSLQFSVSSISISSSILSSI